MLKKYRFFSLFFVLFIESLSAYSHPSPGGFAVEGYYLYWVPSVEDTYFVIKSPVSSPTGPRGKRINNDFDYHSGFRVGAAYAFCDCGPELSVYYTHLFTRTSKSVSGGFLWGTQGRAPLAGGFTNYNGSASSDMHITYNRVDGFLSQKAFNDCCGFDVYLQAGIEFAYFRLKESFQYVNFLSPTVTLVADIQRRSKTWGVGPEFGVEFDYIIRNFSCCCPGSLSLVGNTSGSILVSRAFIRETDVLNGVTFLVDLLDRHTWRLVPAWHAQVGLNFTTCFGCWGALLEIGYEFNTYLRAINRYALVNDTAAGETYTRFNNFNAHGLYVTAAITF